MKAIVKVEALAAHILGNACDLLQLMECSLKSTEELKVEALAHILGNTCDLLQLMECSLNGQWNSAPKNGLGAIQCSAVMLPSLVFFKPDKSLIKKLGKELVGTQPVPP